MYNFVGLFEIFFLNVIVLRMFEKNQWGTNSPPQQMQHFILGGFSSQTWEAHTHNFRVTLAYYKIFFRVFLLA